MKVSLFEQVPYRYIPEGFEEQHSSVVTAPYQFVQPGRMQESLLSAYAELLHGARAGFDGICVTEHSQSSYDISPNPTLLASAVGCAAQAEGLDVAITILGRSLGKTREPLKIAEEYALLDCISGGRLIAGFPVGLSYDANLNAALPAIETRDRAREHRELIPTGKPAISRPPLMQSRSAYSSAIFSGSRVFPSERPSTPIATSRPSACAAQATAEASRVGLGETSYDDWLCSVTQMPSNPVRAACSNSA